LKDKLTNIILDSGEEFAILNAFVNKLEEPESFDITDETLSGITWLSLWNSYFCRGRRSWSSKERTATPGAPI
jgi:hypothetical protein